MEPTTSDPDSLSDDAGGAAGRERDAFRITLSGDIDIMSKPLLLALVAEFRRSPARDVVVDLSAVDFMDSTGIGALFRLRRVTLGRAGRLRLVAPSRRVRRAIDVTGLSALCDIEGL